MDLRPTAFRWCLAALLGLLGLSSVAPAQDAEKDDQQKIDSKAQKNSLASAIAFKKELGLPYASLGTLGTRIDAARRSHDPVRLAHAANELAVAEKVSGKSASITSTALIKEAAEVAKLRREVAELQAVQHVNDQIATETELATDLKKNIADAKARAQAETDSIRRGEEPTDEPRKLLVNNYTTQHLDIYVNGFLKMQVAPGASKWCVIEHKWNPTVMKAYGDEDTITWGPNYIWGRYKAYTWNVN